MPSGCLFCDVCGSYDHDSSNCPHAFPDGNDDFDNNESDQVNYVSNYNNVQRTYLEEIIENQTKLLSTYMVVSEKKLNEVITHNKMLENKISQLANDLKGHASPSYIPSQGLDPKRPMNAIVTRSAKVLEESLPRKSGTKEVPKEALVEDERNGASLSEVVIETPREVRVEKEIVKPKLPYPQKFMRYKLEEQFGRFIDMPKQLHLSIPFTEVVTLMPNYAKFLKDILSGRRSCDVVETVNLIENFSAIIMNKMPPKLKDPGNFFIPCAIKINNTLFDLGDFVVLEKDEDATIPITLGRHFLAASGAMINVKSAKILLKVGEEVIEFDLIESMKYPCSSLENCMLIDSLDLVVSSKHDHLLTSNDPIENVFLNKDKI
ncbi:uncharacterized protein LOC110701651 [Chenopodium quinoa]|uniref:uncharacterized protein LOC110701651 n=1 Tax=Chenopodium quinoa TaxID=63459 RepID=UPI000B783629|nr:uncharacterized protein LOC110701651 [Chenopodium quinoa]